MGRVFLLGMMVAGIVVTALTVSAVVAPRDPAKLAAADPGVVSGLVIDEWPETPTPTPTPTSTPDPRVAQVEELFAGRPLAKYAGLMVATADRYGIDWRLMPSIGFMESGGGREACGGNAWGWAACRVSFASFEEGVEIVAQTLAKYPYEGEDIATIACIWQSGKGCTSYAAVEYAYNIAYFYEKLGGSFSLPARLPNPDDVVAEAEPAEAVESTTPVPTPAGGSSGAEEPVTQPTPPTPEGTPNAGN